MPAAVSEPVADLAAAAEKVRADDRLVTSPELVLADLESLLHTRTMIDAVVVRRISAAQAMDATRESCGRSLKGYINGDYRWTSPTRRHTRTRHLQTA